MNALTLTVSTLPNMKLTTNGRRAFIHNPYGLAKAVRVERERAYWLFTEALQGRQPRFERVRLSWVLTFPQKRSRDADGILGGALKIWQDSIVDLGIIKDDSTEYIIGVPALDIKVDKLRAPEMTLRIEAVP
tara:strand:- start:92 stop:487 length:396 start_codon:yes stop_codon:yes gene_type:complete